MASTIVPTTASWATTNMKPGPGEQADALWAQKIADNTGFLYNREIDGPTICYQQGTGNLEPTSGTYFFKKKPGLNTFVGSFTGFVGAAGNAVAFTLKVDGTTFHTASHNGTVLKFGTQVSVGGLTDENVYELTYKVAAVSSTAGSCMMALTTWFKS